MYTRFEIIAIFLAVANNFVYDAIYVVKQLRDYYADLTIGCCESLKNIILECVMPYFNRFEDYIFSKYRAQIFSSYSNRRHTAKYYNELMEIPELTSQLIGLLLQIAC